VVLAARAGGLDEFGGGPVVIGGSSGRVLAKQFLQPVDVVGLTGLTEGEQLFEFCPLLLLAILDFLKILRALVKEAAAGLVLAVARGVELVLAQGLAIGIESGFCSVTLLIERGQEVLGGRHNLPVSKAGSVRKLLANVILMLDVRAPGRLKFVSDLQASLLPSLSKLRLAGDEEGFPLQAVPFGQEILLGEVLDGGLSKRIVEGPFVLLQELGIRMRHAVGLKIEMAKFVFRNARIAENEPLLSLIFEGPPLRAFAPASRRGSTKFRGERLRMRCTCGRGVSVWQTISAWAPAGPSL
jgi:hypothetical protein